MNDTKPAQGMNRREFLRGAAGGALALGAGAWLGAGEAAAQATGDKRLFLSTFLAASVLDITIKADGSVVQRTLAQFGTDDQDRVETTAGMVVGPNNNLFVFSPGSDQIFMLDKTNGDLKRTLKGSFISTSHNGAIGPDGMLYTLNAPSLTAIPGSSRPDSIERFDPATGDHIDTFTSMATNPAVRAPFGIIWGPDGDLYVSSALAYGFNPNDFSFLPDHISRFDGKTGQFKGFVVRETHITFNMAFHPSGRLLVPEHFFNRIYTFDISNAKRVDAFIDVDYPIGLAYGPDGDLYVASFSDQEHINKLIDTDPSNDRDAQGAGRILRFDGRKGGRPKATILTDLPYAGYLTFA